MKRIDHFYAAALQGLLAGRYFENPHEAGFEAWLLAEGMEDRALDNDESEETVAKPIVHVSQDITKPTS